MTGDTTVSIALIISLVMLACSILNTFRGQKSKTEGSVEQRIKDAAARVAEDTKVSVKLDQIDYNVKSIMGDIASTKREVRELDKKVALLDASLRSAHKRMDGAGIGRLTIDDLHEHERNE